MKLTIYKRAGESNLTKMRWEKKIPAVVYSQGMENEEIFIDGHEFKKLLAKLPYGGLSTIVFELEGDGKACKAIVKDIQYHVTSYEILHMDFQRIFEDKPIKVLVPIRCVGTAECKGVKLGGTFRQPLKKVKVKCLPKNLPHEFVLDVSEMEMMSAKKIKDLTIPEGVALVRANPKEIVAVIGKI